MYRHVQVEQLSAHAHMPARCALCIVAVLLLFPRRPRLLRPILSVDTVPNNSQKAGIHLGQVRNPGQHLRTCAMHSAPCIQHRLLFPRPPCSPARQRHLLLLPLAHAGACAPRACGHASWCTRHHDQRRLLTQGTRQQDASRAGKDAGHHAVSTS